MIKTDNFIVDGVIHGTNKGSVKTLDTTSINPTID
jgi:hypothetical protein